MKSSLPKSASTPPRVSSATRRDFLRSGLGVAAVGLSSLAILSKSKAATSPGYATSTDKTDDLIFMSATKLAQLIREKKVSAKEAVTAYYKRIDEVNPKINAVVQFCRDRAYKEADAADAALARGEIKGALHGVPMTIKDS